MARIDSELMVIIRTFYYKFSSTGVTFKRYKTSLLFHDPTLLAFSKFIVG